MSGGSANFETVYSVYGRQPAAAIIAEAETRRSVSGRVPNLRMYACVASQRPAMAAYTSSQT